jgi:hypothetical protein
VTLAAPPASFTATPDDTLNVSLAIDTTVSKVYWDINGSAIDASWDKPTLQYVLDGDMAFPANNNVIDLPGSTQVRSGL